MTRRRLLLATAGALVAVTLPVLAGSPSGGTGISIPPTVGATQWTDYGAAAASTETTNVLTGVSCTSASFCAAVGDQNLDTDAGVSTLAELWNGSSWRIVPSPNPAGTADDALNAVSCVGPSFCLAVGGGDTSALVVAWNGFTWNAVPAALPAGADTGGNLTAVSCVSATSCQILGRTAVNGSIVFFGNQWNGSSLSLTNADTPPGSSGGVIPSILGMSCVSAAWCLAVGSTQVHGGGGAPYSELWNGTSWTSVSMPAPSGSPSTILRSVSCAGVGFCTAVGAYGANNLSQAFIESWNGSGWAIATGPTSSESQSLTGVSCFSATTCSAVGETSAATGPTPATLVANWNGTAWSMVPGTPNGGTALTLLSGVSCVTDWACMAVGSYESPAPPNATVPFAMSAPIARSGYRFVASDGGVFAYGSGAPFLGFMGGQHLNKPVVGMAVVPGGDGYDLVAADGGIFSFGSAQFYGSAGSLALNAPIVGMAMTADGAGYWLVASDGGVFAFGDAQFYGSTGGEKLNRPIVGMAATPDGRGYWLVASDGGVFSYGDAQFQGSMGGAPLHKPVVGMAANSAGAYYLVASDGGVFNFPGCAGGCVSPSGPVAPFEGSTGSTMLNKPIVGIDALGDYSGGYYLAGSDGGVFAFPSTSDGPPFYGSTGAIDLRAPIVGIAS